MPIRRGSTASTSAEKLRQQLALSAKTISVISVVERPLPTQEHIATGIGAGAAGSHLSATGGAAPLNAITFRRSVSSSS